MTVRGESMLRRYRPDDERYIKRFRDVFPDISELVRLFVERVHFAEKASVFGAWCAWQPEAAERVKLYGTDLFYERFVRSLEFAEDVLDLVVARYSGWHDEEIESVDEIGSCHDPLQLLSMLSHGFMGYRPDELTRFEIARKLTLATQLMLVAAADPYEWATQDLTVFNILATQRLYQLGVRQRVDVQFTLEPKKHRVDLRALLTVSLSDGAALPKMTGSERMKRYVCRAVKDGDTTFFLYTRSRLKKRISSIIRMERRGRLTDRRGSAQVVVAVQERGVLRPAIRDDVLRVVEIIRERLWQDPLWPEDDMSEPNGDSSSEYWDRKIVGRLHCQHGFHIATPVEQQVTSLVDRLNVENALDGLSHDNYKGEIIRRHILPQWFPQEHYGIDWAAEK